MMTYDIYKKKHTKLPMLTSKLFCFVPMNWFNFGPGTKM